MTINPPFLYFPDACLTSDYSRVFPSNGFFLTQNASACGNDLKNVGFKQNRFIELKSNQVRLTGSKNPSTVPGKSGLHLVSVFDRIRDFLLHPLRLFLPFGQTLLEFLWHLFQFARHLSSFLPKLGQFLWAK